MINLPLTDEEATNLYLILSWVSMQSKVNTSDIFFRLEEIIDPNDDRIDISPKECFAFSKGNRIENGVLIIDGKGKDGTEV